MEIYKILVVDDEPDLCEGLKLNLEIEGYEADTAYSAEEALEMDLTQYDLILLDVMMGKMSGFEIARIIKRNPTTARIPIIFCTAKNADDDMIAGLNLGADDYVTKPYNIRNILARIKSVLRRTERAGGGAPVQGAVAAAAKAEEVKQKRIDSWNESLYRQYLDEYRLPDGSGVTDYENFLACNTRDYAPEIEQSAINVSCNSYFDVDYYAGQVAAWATKSGAYGQARAAWTGESVTAYIFDELHMSLWEHFRTVGLEQQLNPSAAFNTHAYLQARAEAMNKAQGVTTNTVASAIAAIQANGENAIMDYYGYGMAHGLKPTGTATTPSVTPSRPSYNPGGSGSTPPPHAALAGRNPWRQ